LQQHECLVVDLSMQWT